MASGFHRSLSTPQLVAWLEEQGLHPDECGMLEKEKFTGASFLLMEKDDFREIGIGFAGRRLLGNLVEEAKKVPEKASDDKSKNQGNDTERVPDDSPVAAQSSSPVIIVSKGKSLSNSEDGSVREVPVPVLSSSVPDSTVSPEETGSIDTDDVARVDSDAESSSDDLGDERCDVVPFCTQPVEDSSDDESPQGDDNERETGAVGAYIPRQKIWAGRELLRVYFMNPEVLETWMCGTMKMNTANILAWASAWNTPFREQIPKFTATEIKESGDIRVEFTETGSCWSMIGVDAQNVSKMSKPTMSLNLKGHSPDFQKSLVIHEFGHSLGLDHEHQRSDFWEVLKDHINIDKMRSDSRLRGLKPKMKRAAYEADWYKKKTDGVTSDYDPKSIMHYWFDIHWLKSKKHHTRRGIDRDTSLTDKEKKVLKGIHERKTFAKGPSMLDIHYLGEAYSECKSDVLSPSVADGLMRALTPVRMFRRGGPGDPDDSHSDCDSRLDGSDSDSEEDEPVEKDKDKDKVYTKSEFYRLSDEQVLDLVDDIKTLDENDDIGEVQGHLMSAAGDWQLVCRNLHIGQDKIRMMTNSYGQDATRCMGDGIAAWLQLQYNYQDFGMPTWKKVATSVVKVNKKLFLEIALAHLVKGVKVVPDTTPQKQTVSNVQPSDIPGGNVTLKVNTHMRHIKSAIYEAASEWKAIGEGLELSQGTLRSIHGRDIDCLNEVLSKWIHSGKAKLCQLLEVLKSRSVNRTDLVSEILDLTGEKRRKVGLE